MTVAWPVGSQVPDNNAVGLSSTRAVVTTITSITEVKVHLDLGGGWAGDMYCYLAHDGGFAVLLNRPGRSAAEPDGSAAGELLLTLADSAAGDVHTGIAGSGPVSGTFQPDARNIDPANSLDTTPRTAFLANFNGMDANGGWTLYVADVAAGETMTLHGWAITITGVPEPSVVLLGGAGVCLCTRRRRA